MNEMVSIIVPVYNAEKTLERCVRSLIEQTYSNIEIILVNDGSKDDSLLICRQFEKNDNRVIVVDKPNGGVSSARNAGLDIANGEFVMFCDSDDWVEKKWCEILVNSFESDYMVMCGFYTEGKQNVLPYETKANTTCKTYEKTDFSLLYLLGFNVPWNKIYDRMVIEKNLLRFDERFNNGEDYLFNLKYLSRIEKKIIFLDKCLYHYVWSNAGSLSSSNNSNKFEHDRLLYTETNDTVSNITNNISTNYYDVFFSLFEKSITSVLSSNLSFFLKKKELHKILKSKEYQEVAKKSTISSNGVYRKVYQLGSPILVILLYRIKNLIAKMGD
ncbi:MAG: glycosyltransferase family 2 protein [Clostridia bacterium]|nr:glycosyltransferase family 2 protein [Clostridia bacterium]